MACTLDKVQLYLKLTDLSKHVFEHGPCGYHAIKTTDGNPSVTAGYLAHYLTAQSDD